MLQKGKISLRQTGIIFIITAMTLLVRLPGQLSGHTGKASWLVPLAAALIFLPVIYAVKVLLSNESFDSLFKAYTGVFGKAVSGLTAIVTLITALLLMFNSLNSVIARQLTSVTPSVSVGLLAAILLAVVFFIAHGGLTPIARMTEFIAPFLVVVIIGVMLLALPSVKPGNVYPVIPSDVPGVLKYSHIVFAVLGLFVLSLTFSDQTVNPKRLYKMGFKCLIFLCVFAALTVFITFGVLGAGITAKASEPLISVVKSISVFNTLERLDSLIMPIWMIADVASIVVYTYMAMHIIKTLFNLKETKHLAIPIIALCFITTLLLYKSQYMTEWVFSALIVPALILVSFVFPIAALIAGKIRKIV